MRRSIALIALTLAGALAAGPVLAGDTYRVAAEISHAGKPVGAPTLVVKAGKMATVAISGGNGYRLDVEVQPADSGLIDVKANLAMPQGEISSTLTGKADTPMTIATGDIGLKVTVSPHTD